MKRLRELRLVGGACQLQGRIEIFHSGIWGTVCDNGFGYNDAVVVCRQLGSSSWTNVQFYTSGDGVGQIWLDGLACSGTETELSRCGHSGWDNHNCNHNADVGVWCFDASDVNGSWSNWSFWHICSATCNGGIQDRTRKCNAPTPSNGGLYCNETTIESRPCNNIYCEIHGQWGSWQEWESCNTTCGNGLKNRSRNCDSPSPMFGGSDCIGLDFYVQICNQSICTGAERAIYLEPSKQFSAGLLGGVAVGCIVVTAVIIFLGLFLFRRLNPNQTARKNKNAGNNQRLSELRVASQPNEYGRSQRSNGTQSAVYDNIEIGGHTNTQMNCNNEELYENLKL